MPLPAASVGGAARPRARATTTVTRTPSCWYSPPSRAWPTRHKVVLAGWAAGRYNDTRSGKWPPPVYTDARTHPPPLMLPNAGSHRPERATRAPVRCTAVFGWASCVVVFNVARAAIFEE